jgi:hypothetical protein
MRDRAASADTAAIATCPSPMPPHSFGMWGSHSPHSCAALRIPMMPSRHWPRSQVSRSPRSSMGRTTSSMNERTFRRISSTSGGKEKSMVMPTSCRSGFP